MSSTAQFNPESVICNPHIPLHNTLPGCINGWNTIMNPPKGNKYINRFKLNL